MKKDHDRASSDEPIPLTELRLSVIRILARVFQPLSIAEITGRINGSRIAEITYAVDTKCPWFNRKDGKVWLTEAGWERWREMADETY